MPDHKDLLRAYLDPILGYPTMEERLEDAQLVQGIDDYLDAGGPHSTKEADSIISIVQNIPIIKEIVNWATQWSFEQARQNILNYQKPYIDRISIIVNIELVMKLAREVTEDATQIIDDGGGSDPQGDIVEDQTFDDSGSQTYGQDRFQTQQKTEDKEAIKLATLVLKSIGYSQGVPYEMQIFSSDGVLQFRNRKKNRRRNK